MRKNGRFTFDEARKIAGHFVYGLRDHRRVFYVGKTRNAANRFKDYAEQARKSDQLPLVKALREIGDDVRVSILDYMPDDLDAAETREIQKRGVELINIQCNLFREQAGFGYSDRLRRLRYATCSTCNDPLPYGRHLNWCAKCGNKAAKKLNPDAKFRIQRKDLAA